jgi:hypothetical protein
MRKKASWKREIPTFMGGVYGVYFGLSGGAYTGEHGTLEMIYTLFAAGLGVASIGVVITSIMLMRAMRAYEKLEIRLCGIKA